jgi:hypothetical protein
MYAYLQRYSRPKIETSRSALNFLSILQIPRPAGPAAEVNSEGHAPGKVQIFFFSLFLLMLWCLSLNLYVLFSYGCKQPWWQKLARFGHSKKKAIVLAFHFRTCMRTSPLPSLIDASIFGHACIIRIKEQTQS